MERVAVPPKRDSYALRHDQNERLLAAVGALGEPVLLDQVGRCCWLRVVTPLARAAPLARADVQLG